MPTKIQTRWWKEKLPGKVHGAIAALITTYAKNQRGYLRELENWYRLYGNYNSAGLSAHQYSRPAAASANRLTLNVVQSNCDTATAKICKNRPKPTFLTKGGNYSQQKKAKQLDRFCQGMFYQTKAYQKTTDSFLDATIFGTGVLHVYEHENRVCLERVFTDELLIDDMESIYGTPRQIHRRKLYSRDELLEMFPQHKEKITNCPAAEEHADGAHLEATDLIVVIESWHLPSGKIPAIAEDAFDDLDLSPETNPKGHVKDNEAYEQILMDGHDGRHAITIATETLFVGAWRKKYFPFIFQYWVKPTRGMRGQGIPEQLVGVQYDINMTLRQIQQCLPWAVPRAQAPKGAKISSVHINDEIGTYTQYAGAKGYEISTPSVISPELFAHVDRLEAKSYNITGVSQLDAQAKKPSGLESGEALRTMNDIASERFAVIGARYEEAHMELARQMIALAKEISERPKPDGTPQGYPVTIAKKAYTETIDWRDIDLDEDDYVMQIFPTSSLPATPAGRLAFVQDLLALQFLDKTTALRLLNFPDVDAVNSIFEASAEYCNMQIELMLEDGVAQLPQPFMDLEYAKRTAQGAYLLAKTLDVPDGHLELMQNYMNVCVQMLNGAKAGTTVGTVPAGASMAPGALPPGAPIPGMPGPGGVAALPPGPPMPAGGPPPGAPLQ